MNILYIRFILIIGGLLIPILGMSTPFIYSHDSISIDARIGTGPTLSPDIDIESKFGFSGGMGVKKPLNTFLSLASAFMYTQNRLVYIARDDYYKGIFNAHLLTWPVTLRFCIPNLIVSPFIGLGVQGSFNFKSFALETDDTLKNFDRYEWNDRINKFNIGAVGELGLEFHTGAGTFLLIGSYNYDFLPGVNPFPQTEVSMRMSRITVSLGYMYDIVFAKETLKDVPPPVEPNYPKPEILLNKTRMQVRDSNIASTARSFSPLIISLSDNLVKNRTSSIVIEILDENNKVVSEFRSQSGSEYLWYTTGMDGGYIIINEPTQYTVSGRIVYIGGKTIHHLDPKTIVLEPVSYIRYISLEEFGYVLEGESNEHSHENQEVTALPPTLPTIKIISSNFSPDGDGKHDNLIFSLENLNRGAAESLHFDFYNDSTGIQSIKESPNSDIIVWNAGVDTHHYSFFSFSSFSITGKVYYKELDDFHELEPVTIETGPIGYWHETHTEKGLVFYLDPSFLNEETHTNSDALLQKLIQYANALIFSNAQITVYGADAASVAQTFITKLEHHQLEIPITSTETKDLSTLTRTFPQSKNYIIELKLYNKKIALEANRDYIIPGLSTTEGLLDFHLINTNIHAGMDIRFSGEDAYGRLFTPEVTNHGSGKFTWNGTVADETIEWVSNQPILIQARIDYSSQEPSTILDPIPLTIGMIVEQKTQRDYTVHATKTLIYDAFNPNGLEETTQEVLTTIYNYMHDHTLNQIKIHFYYPGSSRTEAELQCKMLQSYFKQKGLYEYQILSTLIPYASVPSIPDDSTLVVFEMQQMD